jgi:hypothetical protein
MKPNVTHLIISTLKGESGSNPQILTCFPNDSGIREKKIISKTLPPGVRSGTLHEFIYNGQDLIVYVSEFQQETSRNDIITLSLLLNDCTSKDTIISILRAIFAQFLFEDIKDINELTAVAKKLFNGLNSGIFNHESYSFDIQGYLNTMGMSLEKELRKVQGGLF